MRTRSSGLLALSAALLAAALATLTPHEAAAQTPPREALMGLWETPDGVRIEMSPCGADLCAVVSRNQPRADIAKAISTLPPQYVVRAIRWRDKAWRGLIVDEEEKSEIAAQLTLQKDGRLALRGCLGILCDTEKWSRPPTK